MMTWLDPALGVAAVVAIRAAIVVAALLLRHDWLLDTQRVLQLLNALLAVHEELEDLNPHGMRERLEEGCLERLKLLGHDTRHRHCYITFSACQLLVSERWRSRYR